MKKIIYRPLALMLSFLGLMVGFTSKVLAQYGAPVMHFKLLGQVKSAECEKPVGGLEVTLVNDATGHVSKAYTDSAGNFNFRIIEYYWEYEFTMNLTDIDGPDAQGQFVSKSVRFKLDQATDGVSTYYWDDNENKQPMMISMDFEGENPCLPATTPDTLQEFPVQAVREEDIPEISPENELLTEPEKNISEKLITDVVLFPNPTDGQFAVSFTLKSQVEVDILMYSLNGQLIDKIKQKAVAGHNIIHLGCEKLPAQTIIVVLTAGYESFNFRVNIIH